MSIGQSSAVQDALVASLSGLRAAPTTGELHLPHQRKISAGPSDTYVRQIQFAGTPGFGRVNSVYLPYTNMVVQGMYVAVDVTVNGTGASTTNDKLPATQGWIGPAGVQALYARTTATWSPQAELIKWQYLNKTGDDRVRSMLASNDLNDAGRIAAGGHDSTTLIGRHEYIIPLDALVDRFFKNLGPLNIHDPNSIELQLDLLPLNRIQQSTGTLTTLASVTINSMKLVLYGHRESDIAARQMQAAFVTSGLKMVMNQPNYFSKTLASSTTSDTLTYSALSGEVTAAEIVLRQAAAVTSTTPTSVNPLAWIDLSDIDAPGNTMSVGTAADPNAYSGTPLSIYQARYMINGQSYVGSVRFLSAESWEDSTAATGVRNVSIIPVSFAARETMGQMYGAFSGSVNVANNLQIILNFDTLAANTLVESLLYTRRVVLVQPTGIAAANEMGF
jgi:hypothetical protein